MRSSVSNPEPPSHLSPLLVALWWDAKGDWNRAHQIADEVGNEADSAGARDAAWVHAYLHRKEGDEGNAGYWYRQAGRPHCKDSLPHEWTQIAGYLLTL